MKCERGLRSVFVVVTISVCLLGPRQSYVVSAADKFQGCATNESAEISRISSVSEGIWKGAILFQLPCGSVVGELYFQNGNAQLRYQIVRNRSSLRIDAEEISLDIRTRLLKLLLKRFFLSEGRNSTYIFATSAFPEISARLAAASATSSEWDPKAGRPYGGTSGAFVTDLMNKEQLYPELSEVFGAFGYKVRVGASENILVLPAAHMSAAGRALITVHVVPTDKFPVSAAHFFKIEKR